MANIKRLSLIAAFLVLSPLAWIVYFVGTSKTWWRWLDSVIPPNMFEGFMGIQQIQLAYALPDLVFFSVLGVVCVFVIRSVHTWTWALCIAIEVVIVRAFIPKPRFVLHLSQQGLFVEQLIQHLLPVLVAVVPALLFMKWKTYRSQSKVT